MGLNNWVKIPDPRDPSRNIVVGFKYGLVWEIVYSVGDTLSWRGRVRPEFADGLVVVPGWAADNFPESTTVVTDASMLTFTHYRISFSNDVLICVEPISEAEHDILEEQLDDRL